MQKKLFSIGIACAMLLAGLSGCSSSSNTTTSTNTGSGEVISDVSITGNWNAVRDGQEIVYEFGEDGSFNDHSKVGRKGTYEFTANNSGFTISKLFDKVEYVEAVDGDGGTLATGAVMQDIMIAYSTPDEKEYYLFREGRDAVTDKELQSTTWVDVNDSETTITFHEDSSVDYFSNSGTYTYRLGEDEKYGSCVYIKEDGEDKETQYVVSRYEDYLFFIGSNGSLYMLVDQNIMSQVTSEAAGSAGSN